MGKMVNKIFCVFFHNSEIMDTNGPTNEKAVLFSREVRRPGQCSFQKMQMYKAQHHNTAGDGLGPGVCITVGFFTRGQGCENRFHSTTCKWVTRATLE